MSKKYRTDVKIRIDKMGIECSTSWTAEELARRVAQHLENMGVTLHQGLDVTVIERTGSLSGKRSTVKLPKKRRGR